MRPPQLRGARRLRAQHREQALSWNQVFVVGSNVIDLSHHIVVGD
jgi:hypothetical protein